MKRGRRGEGGEGESHPHPLPGPRAPETLEGGALTWQEAAVSSELFLAGKAPLARDEGEAANKDFRGIVGSGGGLPGPSRGPQRERAFS